MVAIVQKVDVRRGERYAGNPKNGKRTKKVVEEMKIEKRNLDKLNYPLALSDYMLWYPGMIRTTSYVNVVKSGDCAWRDLEKELESFHALNSNGNTVGLSREELRQLRQFWSVKCL